MKLKKIRKKLERLIGGAEANGAPEIEAKHVEDILGKLDAKRAKLEDKLARTEDEAERDKLQRKLGIVEQQRKRGEELLANIDGDD